MATALSLAITGDLKRFCDAEARAGARAVTTVIRRRTTGLKTALRRQVVTAGLGVKLSKAIRSETQPARGTSISILGRVFSKALTKRPGGLVDLIAVFDEGADIRARGARYLSIPTKAAGKAKSPKQFADGSLAFIPPKAGKPGLLIEKASHRVMFVLVKHVAIGRRLTIDVAVARALSGIDQAIVTTWEREAAKAGVL